MKYKQGNHLEIRLYSAHNGKCLLIQSFEVKCVLYEFVQQIKTTSNNGQIKKNNGDKNTDNANSEKCTQDMVDELQLCKQNVMCVYMMQPLTCVNILN